MVYIFPAEMHFYKILQKDTCKKHAKLPSMQIVKSYHGSHNICAPDSLLKILYANMVFSRAYKLFQDVLIHDNQASMRNAYFPSIQHLTLRIIKSYYYENFKQMDTLNPLIKHVAVLNFDLC